MLILEGMIRRKRMPRDASQLAAGIVKLATGQPVEPEPELDANKPAKNPHAVALGKARGLEGRDRPQDETAQITPHRNRP